MSTQCLTDFICNYTKSADSYYTVHMVVFAQCKSDSSWMRVGSYDNLSMCNRKLAALLHSNSHVHEKLRTKTLPFWILTTSMYVLTHYWPYIHMLFLWVFVIIYASSLPPSTLPTPCSVVPICWELYVMFQFHMWCHNIMIHNKVC